MKGIRKHELNINIKGMVIHQVLKDAGNRTTIVKEANDALMIGEKEKLFISKIYKAYFDSSKPIYGIFDDQDETFKNRLTKYVSDSSFLEFSKDATEHYKKTLMTSVPSTGGFLIFTHFEHIDKGFDYMLVMTMTNKDGFVIEADLSLKDIKNLDLNKIDVGCMINLTKWRDHEDLIDVSTTYLSFAKGEKNVSYYFMSFIDCNNKTTKTESTNRLLKAFEEYCNEKAYDRDFKIKKRNEVFNYCTGCIDEKKEILLSSISALMDSENTEGFERFAADEKYGVSAVINGDKARLKTMKYVSYKDKEITIEFDASLLNKDIFYDRVKKQLTFKNIPDRLAIQIPE
jgi:nucleoid-associated protein